VTAARSGERGPSKSRRSFFGGYARGRESESGLIPPPQGSGSRLRRVARFASCGHCRPPNCGVSPRDLSHVRAPALVRSDPADLVFPEPGRELQSPTQIAIFHARELGIGRGRWAHAPTLPHSARTRPGASTPGRQRRAGTVSARPAPCAGSCRCSRRARRACRFRPPRRTR